MTHNIKIIGTIRSTLKKLEDCPLQESESAPQATVVIDPEYREAMKDIQRGDHLILFTWLHQSDRSTLTTHPRNDLTAPLHGVFSTRSPDRPNPIGMHIVEVASVVNENTFEVVSLEVLDGTPLIDIKPDLNRK